MSHPAPVVVCVGDLAVDEVVSVTRLPASGGKADGTRIGAFAGGMAANAAVALAKLGVRARLFAAVGDDARGITARTAIEASGVDGSGIIVVPETATFACLVLIDGRGEKALVRLSSEAYLPRAQDIAPDLLVGADHVHVTLGSADLTRTVMAQARALGTGLSLDAEAPDIINAGAAIGGIIAQSNVVFTNEAALAVLVDRIGAGAVAAIPELVITRGRDGADVRTGGASSLIAGHRVDVVDATGAGDCFAAAYVTERLRGARVDEAGRFAAVAAALSATAFGAQTAMPTRAMVENALTLPVGAAHR